MSDNTYDVVVVGGGNAALCAALAAAEQGAGVGVLEAAPEAQRGGNSRYTGGIVRMTFNGAEDVTSLVDDLSEEELARTDFGAYSAEDFFDDMGRLTRYRCHPELTEVMIDQSLAAYQWLKEKGVRFAAPYNRQAFQVDGKFTFWGGIAVETVGGGEGLMASLYQAVEKAGVEVHYATRALDLLTEEGRVTGVRVRRGGEAMSFHSGQVVLACGGFESNAEWRTRYLGPGWDLAKVRGTRYNLGDGIAMALAAGAMAYGQWSGCHAVGWDLNAPDFGDLSVGDAFQKHSYPFSVMVNSDGLRFVDEGADFRNFTYARYGRDILEQPGQVAWQVFDGKTLHLQRDEYRIRRVTKVRAETLEQLAERMEDMNAPQFLETIAAYNAAVMSEVPFDPNVKDGRGTRGLDPPKSNWAVTLDEPPFEAYATTCGVTFTFGGLKIDTRARVLDTGEEPIAGLYAAGELVGGLFYFNYPGGTGLTSGAVFGRIAGTEAGKMAGKAARAP